MVDKETGKLYTKISGQIWYDQKGITPDDRGKVFLIKTSSLTEQKRLIEDEMNRKRVEEELQKKPSLDVSSWITSNNFIHFCPNAPNQTVILTRKMK